MTSALITAAAAVGLLIIIIVAIILFRMLSDNFGQSTYVYSRSYRRKKRSQPLIFLIGILAGLTIGAIVAYFIILKPGQSQPPIERQQNSDSDQKANRRHGRRNDGHLHQSGRRVHIAGKTRKNAARLHIPKLQIAEFWNF